MEKLQNELISFSVENSSLKLEILGKEEALKKLVVDDGYLREDNIMLKRDISDSIDCMHNPFKTTLDAWNGKYGKIDLPHLPHAQHTHAKSHALSHATFINHSEQMS